MNIKENKQILLISPRGFCAGVTRAIDTVVEVLEKFGPPVYVKHEIVHNKHVIDDLKAKGAIFIEDINDAPIDKPLVFSAHGVAKNILDTAKQMNKYVVDATCPLVTKVHVQAIKFYNLNYKIILIGHKNHPEVEGTLGQLPAGAIVLIENLDDIQNLKFENEDKLAYVTQTTLSVDDTKEIIDALKKKFPHIKSSPKEDICYATTNRQNAIKDYAHECDSFIVVGSKNSSNSNRLVEVAKKSGCDLSVLLENASNLNIDNYKNHQTIGLSSGASVPDILVQDVISKFREAFEINVKEVGAGEENISFKLPRGI
jgi:4-hydroxy-3-methylbut-2-enyl diphosphate reductase|tara:strand:+ start:1044 stop:1985 length:942 start_codon:yes stop_codon:yes gene_type:complete